MVVPMVARPGRLGLAVHIHARGLAEALNPLMTPPFSSATPAQARGLNFLPASLKDALLLRPHLIPEVLFLHSGSKVCKEPTNKAEAALCQSRRSRAEEVPTRIT